MLLLSGRSAGSPSAVVNNLKVEVVTDVEEFEGFEIRY